MKPHYLHEVMGAEEADTTELERSLSEAIAEVTAASETSDAPALTEPDLSNKRLIKRTRTWFEGIVPQLARREADLQTKLAAANADCEATIAKATATRDAIVRDVEEDLYQVEAVRTVLTKGCGDLTKAEL